MSPARPARWITLGALLAIGDALMRCWVQRWSCDDAFICYRYACNFADGEGLVYNIGERVEGYSNLLWTLLLAGWMRLGIEPIIASQMMGVASLACLLGLALVYGCRLARESDAPVYLPLTALALALNADIVIWGTSGMETMGYTALLFAAFVLLTREPGAGWSALGAGVCLALSTLTRPDGVLVSALCCGWLLLVRRWGDLLRVAICLVATQGPFLLWRHAYYGEWLPNTYYAKSAWIPKWEQGLHYVRLYVDCYRLHGIVLMALLLAGWAAYRRSREGGARAPLPRAAPIGLAALAACGYVAYVARVGGDFMFARFMIPATPLVYALTEALLARVDRPLVRNAAAIAVLALTAVRAYPYAGEQRILGGVADERAYYSPQQIELNRENALELRRFFDEVPVRIAYFGTEAALAYYAAPRLAIESECGKTDYYLARLPRRPDGRPGHDKPAPFSYLLERRVHFVFQPLRMRELGGSMQPYQRVRFGRVQGRIICYERDVMEALGARGAEFVDFPAWLDRYLETAHELEPVQLQRDYDAFRDYYFRHNHDPARERRFEALLDGR